MEIPSRSVTFYLQSHSRPISSDVARHRARCKANLPARREDTGLPFSAIVREFFLRWAQVPAVPQELEADCSALSRWIVQRREALPPPPVAVKQVSPRLLRWRLLFPAQRQLRRFPPSESPW